MAESVTWSVLHGPLLVVLHAGLGLLLVLISVQLLAQGIRARTRRLVLPAAFGTLGVIGAGFNGGSFLNYDQDFSSMLMAAFFGVAVISYVIGLYLTPASRDA